VLSWDRGDLPGIPAEAMSATIDAGRRGRDLVIVDLPRHLDGAAVIALQATDRLFVVVPAELRATAAAARVVAAAGEPAREFDADARRGARDEGGVAGGGNGERHGPNLTARGHGAKRVAASCSARPKAARRHRA